MYESSHGSELGRKFWLCKTFCVPRFGRDIADLADRLEWADGGVLALVKVDPAQPGNILWISVLIVGNDMVGSLAEFMWTKGWGYDTIPHLKPWNPTPNNPPVLKLDRASWAWQSRLHKITFVYNWFAFTITLCRQMWLLPGLCLVSPVVWMNESLQFQGYGLGSRCKQTAGLRHRILDSGLDWGQI